MNKFTKTRGRYACRSHHHRWRARCAEPGGSEVERRLLGSGDRSRHRGRHHRRRGLRGLRSWLLRWRSGWVPLGCSLRRLGQLPRLREGLRPLLSLPGQEFQSSIGASAPLPPPRRLNRPAPTVPVGAGRLFRDRHSLSEARAGSIATKLCAHARSHSVVMDSGLALRTPGMTREATPPSPAARRRGTADRCADRRGSICAVSAMRVRPSSSTMP